MVRGRRSSHDEVLGMADVVESRGAWAARAAVVVHCLSVVSEVEEAMDLDGHRYRILGSVLFSNAFCVWTLIESARCWASMQQPIPYHGS